MTHKPTFKVSSQQRPIHRRLTPLGWALVGLAVLVVGVGLGLTAMVVHGDAGGGAAWHPTPTDSPTPTTGPTAIAEPVITPSPTVWYAGIVTPTPALISTSEPALAFPAWWSGEMTQDEEGSWWPPEEVSEMVINHILTADGIYNASIVEGVPVDLEAHETYLYDWYSGEQLESALDYVQNYREGAPIAVATWRGGCLREVQEWSSDGLECTYGVSCQDGTLTEYDPLTGEIVSETHIDYGGLIRLRMRYDPSNGHWKFHTLTGYTPIGGD